MQKNVTYPKVKVIDVLRAFWAAIKVKKWNLYILIACIILGNIVAMIVPIFYKQFFDSIISNQNKLVTTKHLTSIIINVLILNGVYWIFYRIASLANNDYQPKVMATLKQQAYEYLMNHSYSFFANNFIGSLVQRVNRFARAFEVLSDRFIWDLLPVIVRVIVIFIVVLFINQWIALIILIWSIVFLSFNLIFSRWKLKYDLRAAEVDSQATGYLADTITNQNTVQLFNRFGFESKGYQKITDEQSRMTKLTFNLDGVVEGGQAFLGFIIEFILFFFAIKYWQQGIITVGVFVLLQAYLVNIMSQLWGVTRIVRDIYRSYADAKEMVEIMMLPHEIQDVLKAKNLVAGQGQIEFKNLNFSFNDTRKVLENINILVKPGEKIALIGPSGAGKTTFVKLLLRLYSPTSGNIFIDGQDIAKVTQSSLRNNISMVPQDPVLFHRTLADNIAYGKHNASMKEIETAATLAHCDDFIKELPQGLETYVGERGIKLSGGERQRVAIARAILKNAPILVLDEATSSLDSRSEMLIQDALSTLMQGKTTIVIAHRLSTIQKMDRIIVIDQGNIIEEGSHSELLAKENSLYKKLWMLQAGGFLSDEDKQSEEKKSEDLGAIDDDENGKSERKGEAQFTKF